MARSQPRRKELLVGPAQMLTAPAVPLEPATPAARLLELAGSGYPAMRLRVAQHPKTPRQALIALRRDAIGCVRAAARRRLRAMDRDVLVSAEAG